MKRLDHKFINVRVWLERRRLRRMGFRDVADNASKEALLRLKPAPLEKTKPSRNFVKVILAILAFLILCLTFWHGSLLHTRISEPIQRDSSPIPPIAPDRQPFRDLAQPLHLS